MFKIGAFRELKSRLEGRVVLFAADVVPVDRDQYFDELFTGLSFRGLAHV